MSDSSNAGKTRYTIIDEAPRKAGMNYKIRTKNDKEYWIPDYTVSDTEMSEYNDSKKAKRSSKKRSGFEGKS